MAYWLMKSEPSSFGIDDLQRKVHEPWDGVRNYQARNYIRSMQPGDAFFFYHSNCAQPGITGIGRIITSAYPDGTQFDPTSAYHDPASSPDKPRWWRVDVGYERHLRRLITLSELKQHPQLATLALVRKGSRLSVMPVEEADWHFILALE